MGSIWRSLGVSAFSSVPDVGQQVALILGYKHERSSSARAEMVRLQRRLFNSLCDLQSSRTLSTLVRAPETVPFVCPSSLRQSYFNQGYQKKRSNFPPSRRALSNNLLEEIDTTGCSPIDAPYAKIMDKRPQEPRPSARFGAAKLSGYTFAHSF